MRIENSGVSDWMFVLNEQLADRIVLILTTNVANEPM
jgi:hypothetical protein